MGRDAAGDAAPWAVLTNKKIQADETSHTCSQAISRTGNAALFAAIGTTYGAGDGSTTFNVPDLRGRIGAGKDDMGGSAAGNLTTTTMSPNGTTLGATGGHETPTGPNSTVAVNTSSATQNAADFGHTHVGGGVQPTIFLNYIIKT